MVRRGSTIDGSYGESGGTSFKRRTVDEPLAPANDGDDHPYWITRSEQLPDEEIAEADSLRAGRRALRTLLLEDGEDGPLFLFGPGLDVPDKAWVDFDGNVVIQTYKGGRDG